MGPAWQAFHGRGRAWASLGGRGQAPAGAGWWGMMVATDGNVRTTAATNIISSGATLNGEVTNTGGQSPDITLYWGDNDGGTTPGSWENAIPLGPQATIFSANISGLTATTTYYYRRLPTTTDYYRLRLRTT